MNELRSFYRKHPTVKFAKGEVIFQQDELPKHVYAIKSGAVKLSNINDKGEDQLISFEIVDDVVPICWAFSTTSKALFYYDAYTDCELYVIPKEEFDAQLVTNHTFTRAMLDRQLRSYIGNMLQVDALEKPRAYIKLLYTFRYLCLRYGRDIKKDFVKIYVPFTQQDIADATDLTRETTTLELLKMKKQKIISVRLKYYTVDTSKLNAQIEDEYDPGIEVSMLTKVS